MTGDARAFFDAIARRYDRAYAPDGPSTRHRVATIAALLSPPGRLLDLGVGTGRELSVLQDLGFAPTGVDVSRAMLERCARRARPIPLVEGDFWRALPFDDGSFEGVVAFHGTLTHPPGRGAYAALGAEIARVLTDGGVFVAELPARAWLEQVAVGASVASSDRSVRRVSADECVYEDLVTGASVTAFIPDDASWSALFAPALAIRVEPLDADAIALVGRPKGARAVVTK